MIPRPAAYKAVALSGWLRSVLGAFSYPYIVLYTYFSVCIRWWAVLETEVLSVRVKKSLKDEAERMGIDVKAAVEELLEELVAEKKAKAKRRAEELRRIMHVTEEEWVQDIKATRQEM